MNQTFINSTNLDLCVSGASISRCPWATWVDFLKDALLPNSVIDHSCKGAGNHYIVRSAIHGLQSQSNRMFLALMLTNFDKYDMWVRDEKCKTLQIEKHPPHWIDGTRATQQGFWCTGSHFPLIKEVYHQNFFDLEISAAQDLTNLLGLIKFCEDKAVPFLIMFDSPVFANTEYQINDWCKKQSPLTDRGLTESVIVKPLIDALAPYILDKQGLIGFCIDQGLPWYNSKYGPHPPSISHYLYFQEKILPWITDHYPNLKLKPIEKSWLLTAEKMTTRWTKNGF